MEQMQARERALQARAAAAAAQNANLLQNLDAFRGVHLDPNAHHWDEVSSTEKFFQSETCRLTGFLTGRGRFPRYDNRIRRRDTVQNY
jgi:hypothetical protein